MKTVVAISQIQIRSRQISSRCWSVCRELNTTKCFDSP